MGCAKICVVILKIHSIYRDYDVCVYVSIVVLNIWVVLLKGRSEENKERERECCSFFLHKSSMVRSMVYSSIEICMYVSLIALGLTITQGLGHDGTKRRK